MKGARQALYSDLWEGYMFDSAMLPETMSNSVYSVASALSWVTVSDQIFTIRSDINGYFEE